MSVEQNNDLESSTSIDTPVKIISDNTSEECNLLLSAEDKLSYAKKVLYEEQIDGIEITWIVAEWMTKEKLDVLGNDDLTIDQIIALWGENISHELMTDEKLTVVGYMFSASDIENIWAENIARISIDELNSIV